MIKNEDDTIIVIKFCVTFFLLENFYNFSVFSSLLKNRKNFLIITLFNNR